MNRMDTLIKTASGKVDMTAETNRAIDAYNAALTAYNKMVDAANGLNPGAACRKGFSTC